MIEAFNIIQDRSTRSRLAGDPPDFTIRPKLKGIGLTDFYKADEVIQLGYEEGRARIGELKGNRAVEYILNVCRLLWHVAFKWIQLTWLISHFFVALRYHLHEFMQSGL